MWRTTLFWNSMSLASSIAAPVMNPMFGKVHFFQLNWNTGNSSVMSFQYLTSNFQSEWNIPFLFGHWLVFLSFFSVIDYFDPFGLEYTRHLQRLRKLRHGWHTYAAFGTLVFQNNMWHTWTTNYQVRTSKCDVLGIEKPSWETWQSDKVL